MNLTRKEKQWNDFIEGLDGSIQQALDENLNGDELKHRVKELIQFNCGGLVIYIPKGFLYRVNARNNLIRKEFNGANHYELARKYGLTEQQIYTIVKGC